MRGPASSSACALGALLLAGCLPAWWIARSAFLAVWLATWFYCLGIVLGGLANVWIHTLTGGAWGEAIRAPLLQLGRMLPWLSVLFLPVLVGVSDLYPWAVDPIALAGEVEAPGFKSVWLQPEYFALRAMALLVLWNLLAWASRQPGLERSRGFAAAALVLYGFSISVAAVDWIMSLMPLWYSSSFGLLVAMGQILAGMAFAAIFAATAALEAQVRRDIGNFLLAYVMTWAYLAFTQFLVIWSENLPHEIAWYVVRRDGGWLVLGVILAMVQFAAPLLLLLFRAVKDSPRRLAWTASGLLAAHLLDVWWLVLPSVPQMEGWQLTWLLPLSAAGLLALGYGLFPLTGGHREMRSAHHG
ncbi:MAG TPA: hypothetical protein VJ673_14575 [Aromatoleum sp.]|uniref:hypothetical protein n=1 Tax=Aromatoleum sp. TaxID=2307007 RepID=UPI002B463F4B|nr:hypothetical protein [Aromatoleum sp.]HJV26910.1 hypothetical protein [Aromatoleum sp.]